MSENTAKKREILKKKIFLITPTLQAGGQERVAVNTAEILKKEYDVSIIVFNGADAVYHPSCQVIDIDIPASGNSVSRLFNALKRGKKVSKIIGADRDTVMLSFGETANLVNAIALSRVKRVMSIRSYVSLSKNYVSKFVYSRADAIICCSKKLQLDMLKMYPQHQQKIKYLPNVYDIDAIRARGAEPVNDYEFHPHTIVAQGRLEDGKDFPRLIRAFSLVKDEIPDAQLLIIGEGSRRAELTELVQKLRVEDSVSLIGFRKNTYAYLSKSALYVLPSLAEGFPNALVEGMVFLPVVAVDCPTGPREILSDGPLDRVAEAIEETQYGTLIKPTALGDYIGDITKRCDYTEYITSNDRILAQAIISLLKDPKKAEEMKSAARARVEKYSVEAYKKMLIDILNA